MFSLALPRVDLLKIALEHKHFAPHIEPLRYVLTLEFQGNGTNGTDVFRHLFARRTVAARGRLNEDAVVITQRNGQSVEFQFACVFHGRVAERVGDAFIERNNVFVRETVVQREHGHVVRNRLKTRGDLAADALRGGVRRDQFWLIGLDLLQLLEQDVVFGVRQIRLIEHVIRVIGALELRAQPGGALSRPLRAGDGRTMRSGSGGDSGISFGSGFRFGRHAAGQTRKLEENRPVDCLRDRLFVASGV